MFAYFPLNTALWIESQFEKELTSYSTQVFYINKLEKVILINDSLALYIELVERKTTSPISENKLRELNAGRERELYENTYYSVMIEEVTYNEIQFRHNNEVFVKNLELELEIDYLNHTLPAVTGSSIIYTKYVGFTDRIYWAPNIPTTAQYVDLKIPELRLRERYENWPGIHYYFIVIEFTDSEGKTNRAVAYTQTRPDQYIVSFGNRYIKKGSFSSEIRTDGYQTFLDSLNSWKGVKRQKRLEDNLQYFFIEKNIREKRSIWKYADELLKKANSGSFKNAERSTYLRPVYRWKNEELVLKNIKRLYGTKYKVISQHRPFFLRSSYGGQMSYDVFIAGVNIAVEYQGKQHFEPVDYFGGEEAFKKLQIRDAEKKRISEENGVKMVYFYYNETISSKLIRERIDHCIEVH